MEAGAGETREVADPLRAEEGAADDENLESEADPVTPEDEVPAEPAN